VFIIGVAFHFSLTSQPLFPDRICQQMARPKAVVSPKSRAMYHLSRAETSRRGHVNQFNKRDDARAA
jgi:hypothetical protein